MLVLSRKVNEQLVIGENIVVTIIRTAGGKVSLGIEAPRDISIRRMELDPYSSEAAAIRNGDCNQIRRLSFVT